MRRANAGSAALSAYTGGWTQTCLLRRNEHRVESIVGRIACKQCTNATYCYGYSVVCVCMSLGHNYELYKNGWTNRDAFWVMDTVTHIGPLQFRILENPRWRRPPSWKSQKSRYLRNGLTNLYEIWYRMVVQNGSQRLRQLKMNFKNPRWRTAAILKTVKSPYLCNLLTDFD